jgi:hypothetical protein
MYPEYKIKDEIKKTFFSKKNNIISKKGRELK